MPGPAARPRGWPAPFVPRGTVHSWTAPGPGGGPATRRPPMSVASLTVVHRQFKAALPALTTTARLAFRRLGRQDRDEAIAAVHAAAWSAWHGLLARGRDPLAVGACGIANNAVRYVRNGRR